MVQADNKQKLWIALGAVGALVATALAVHFLTSEGDQDDTSPPEISQSELLETLASKGLDKVQRQDGMLEPNYFLKLLQFIGETNKARLADTRARSHAIRREHYKNEDWSGYEQCVKKSFEEEDRSAQELMQEVSSALNISQGEFQSTHQTMASDPTRAEMVMAAQQGKYAPPDLKKKPTLSKQKTMEVLDVTQDASNEMVERLKELENQPGDQMEKMMTFMIEQMKMQDKIFLQTGVENEDFEDSLMYFMRTDPDVQRKMQAYMMKMQMEASRKGM